MKKCKVLFKSPDKAISWMIPVNKNVLQQVGWANMTMVEAWSVNGFYTTRIARDCVDSWIALQNHFLNLATTEDLPWDYVQIEIDNHTEELELFQNTADSRLQALVSIYCYLRDGVVGSWHSTALQYKRNAEVFQQNNTGNYFNGSDTGAPAGGGRPFTGCPHCGTRIHTGNKSRCPWKTLAKKKA
jgi:hypothetical protein